MPAPDIIKQLVDRYDQHRETYRAGKYNETQLRNEFLNPFLEALGWDVFNKQGYAETYKDVIHEDSLEIEGESKAPDYAFRIGGTRKFFVEAKKPAVNIESDIHPAFQLRRYSWSAKLPLGILTDFEEFAIYDCRVKPDKADKASTGRVKLLSYKDYIEKWDEIAAIFSREAVLKGSFDSYAEGLKGRKGTTEVDDAFLAEIEGWRDLLAKNIALRNDKLSVRELNYAVQMTIDRIVFLRICEDRGVERDEQLKEIALTPPPPSLRDTSPISEVRNGGGQGGGVYAALCQLFQRADARYNSGLFHFKDEKGQSSGSDSLTLGLKIDDKILQDILLNLYYPESPYVFKEIPSDILGQVYERFLGKVIRLTAGHQAKVEEKPEVRKAGGVYYTPTYIVNYIVKNTVGKLLEGRTPKTAASLKILDPACGSGTFPLGAYQYLLDWHLKWYSENEPQKWLTGKQPAIYESGPHRPPAKYSGQAATSPKSDEPQSDLGEVGRGWRLTTAKKKEILLNNIHGVDIDPQAVEVTKLSLLLKVLEGESFETIGSQLSLLQERVLPDLGRNIQCGNSLIGPDYYEGHQLTMSFADDEERARVNVFDWKAAFPQIFIQGGFDAVVGNPPWGAEFADDERNYLTKKYTLVPSKTKDSYFYFLFQAIKNLRKGGAFGFIMPNTWLLINNAKEIRQELLSLDVQQIIDYGDGVFAQATVESSILILVNSKSGLDSCQTIRYRKGKKIVDHIVEKRLWLGDELARIVVDVDIERYNLLKKLHSVSEPFEMHSKIIWGIKPYQIGYGEPPQTREMLENRVFHSTTKIDEKWKPLLVGSNVNRYSIQFPGNRFIKYGKWLMYPSNESLMLQPKILLRQTSDILRASYDDEKYYCQNSVFIIHSSEINLKYLLGLLNSNLFKFVYQFGNPQKGKVFAEIKPSVIKQLPIRSINFSDPTDKARHERMVSLVERMLALHKQSPRTPQEKESLAREIESTDRMIDGLVYELYGLSEEEIRIVEG